MLNVENVATPLTAVTLVVPDSVPPLGFDPSATVIDPVKPVTTFPASSSAETRTAGIVWPAWVVCGCVVKATWVAGGGGGGAPPGLSASTVASQVVGRLKVHCDCGWAEPALDDTR